MVFRNGGAPSARRMLGRASDAKPRAMPATKRAMITTSVRLLVIVLSRLAESLTSSRASWMLTMRVDCESYLAHLKRFKQATSVHQKPKLQCERILSILFVAKSPLGGDDEDDGC